MAEKEVADVKTGELKKLRTLNGDETWSGNFCIMSNENPDYGGFLICVTIPARTIISEVEVYSLEGNEEYWANLISNGNLQTGTAFNPRHYTKCFARTKLVSFLPEKTKIRSQ